MDKNIIKGVFFMKPCKQVLAFGTNFHGYSVPKYALFGSVSGVLYVCTNVFGYREKITKQKHFPLKVWNGFRYENTTTENYPTIRKYIVQYMNNTPDFVREKCIYCEHRSQKAMREELYIRSLRPGFKEHPQPQYGAKSGCYSQARVDGCGYDISWEEKSKPELGILGLPYTGDMIKYKERMPVATFGSFEGYTDTQEAHRRDGMKVKQIKCRPGKPYITES